MKKTVIRQFRALIILFSTLIVLITSICFLIFSQINEKQIEVIQHTNLLQAYVTYFDSVIQQYHELAIEISGTPTLRSFVLNSDKKLSNDVTSIKSLLAIAKSQHAYLCNIWLYDVRSDTIVDDQYNYTSLEDAYCASITSKFLDGSINQTRINYNGYTTSLFFLNNDLYIARELPILGENRLGILFMKLRISSILGDYLLENTFPETYVVFNEDHQVIKPLSTADDQQIQICQTMISNHLSHQLVENNPCSIVSSKLTNWYYCAFFDHDYALDLRGFISILAPMVLVITIIAVMFSRFLYKLYINPLEKIVNSIRSDDATFEGNEFEVISQSLTSASDSIQKFNSVIMDISPQMAENMFGNLYDGIPMTINYIRGALNILHIPFKLNGLYWTMVIKSTENQDFQEYIGKAIKTVLDSFRDFEMVYHINNHSKYIVVLIEMRNSNNVNFYCSTVFRRVADQLSELPYPISIGRGDFVYNFTDVHLSYTSAVSNVQGIAVEKIDEHVPNAVSTENYETGVARQVESLVTTSLNLVDENKLWQAKEHLKCHLELISKEPPEHFLNVCMQMIEAFAKNVKDITLREGIALQPELTLNMSPEEINDRTQQICIAYLEMRNDRNKRSGYQLVAATKKYIEQHYSDPELSLTTVAEAVKISPGYLSKLFTKYEGKNFIEYLSEYRVRHACEMLIKTDKTVKEILLSCGFMSEQNFFRVFKRIMCLTPKQYRERHQKKEEKADLHQ